LLHGGGTLCDGFESVPFELPSKLLIFHISNFEGNSKGTDSNPSL
jgi:hypothetical protein